MLSRVCAVPKFNQFIRELNRGSPLILNQIQCNQVHSEAVKPADESKSTPNTATANKANKKANFWNKKSANQADFKVNAEAKNYDNKKTSSHIKNTKSQQLDDQQKVTVKNSPLPDLKVGFGMPLLEIMKLKK